MTHPELGSPMDAAGAALAAGAQNAVESRIRYEIKSRLPRFLHPLIPGERGSVRERVGGEIKRRVWRWISGVIASIVFFTVFFGIVGATVLFIVAAIAWSFMTM